MWGHSKRMISPAPVTFNKEIRKAITVKKLLNLHNPHTAIERAYESDLGRLVNTTLEVLSQSTQLGLAIFYSQQFPQVQMTSYKQKNSVKETRLRNFSPSLLSRLVRI